MFMCYSSKNDFVTNGLFHVQINKWKIVLLVLQQSKEWPCQIPFLISVPLFSLPVIFLLHWNISRLFLDSAETDCNLSHLASECLKCLLSVHLIGFHFLARIHVHHVQTKPLCSYSNQDRPPLYSWLSLFLASQKAFQHELTPSESYSVDRGRPHSHYTTLVATCVLGHLKCGLRNSVSVHSGYIHTCIEWFTCDATISVTLWGVGEAIVSRLKECRGARMKRVWKTRGNTEV